jgi:hypothetical protein
MEAAGSNGVLIRPTAASTACIHAEARKVHADMWAIAEPRSTTRVAIVDERARFTERRRR